MPSLDRPLPIHTSMDDRDNVQPVFPGSTRSVTRVNTATAVKPYNLRFHSIYASTATYRSPARNDVGLSSVWGACTTTPRCALPRAKMDFRSLPSRHTGNGSTMSGLKQYGSSSSKGEIKTSALIHRCFSPDTSTMLMNDSLYGGQSHPGSWKIPF